MKKKNLNKILYYISIIAFIILTLGPIVWCFILSLTPEHEMLKETIKFFPSEITFNNYKEILNINSRAHETLFNGLKNSLIISLITVFLSIPISVITGYIFSRYKFKGKNFIMKSILITTVIPVFATVITIYSIFSEYDMLDNLFWISLIYVSAFIPLIIWMMTNYFNSIPKEILEAAQIDGCSDLKIFFKIIIPISKPIIFACILIVFLMSWNQFQIPLIFTSSQKNKVVTLILSEFMTRDTISYGLISVCGIITIIPPVILAIIFRKLLVSGLMSGSVKG